MISSSVIYLSWKSLSHVRLGDPWTIQSREFSRPEYWGGSPSLLQGIFPTQGLNSGLRHAGGFLTSMLVLQSVGSRKKKKLKALLSYPYSRRYSPIEFTFWNHQRGHYIFFKETGIILIPNHTKSHTKKFIEQSHLFCEHTKNHQILYTINDQFYLNKAVFKRKITIAWFLDISEGWMNGVSY